MVRAWLISLWSLFPSLFLSLSLSLSESSWYTCGHERRLYTHIKGVCAQLSSLSMLHQAGWLIPCCQHTQMGSRKDHILKNIAQILLLCHYSDFFIMTSNKSIVSMTIKSVIPWPSFLASDWLSWHLLILCEMMLIFWKYTKSERVDIIRPWLYVAMVQAIPYFNRSHKCRQLLMICIPHATSAQNICLTQ